MNPNTQFKRQSKLPWQTYDDKVVIISPTRQEVHELNETCSYIWEKLAEETNLQQLISQVSTEYEQDAKQIEFDVIDAITTLKNKGLVVEV